MLRNRGISVPDSDVRTATLLCFSLIFRQTNLSGARAFFFFFFFLLSLSTSVYSYISPPPPLPLPFRPLVSFFGYVYLSFLTHESLSLSLLFDCRPSFKMTAEAKVLLFVFLLIFCHWVKPPLIANTTPDLATTEGF